MAAPTKMQYVRLGKSGLKVSKIILGCMTYGDPNWQPWIMPAEKALPIIKSAYDAGINTWDVADTYSNGRSEEILAMAMKEYKIPRESVTIMSKCFHHVDPKRGPVDLNFSVNDDERVNQCGLSRKHIFAAVDASVARLGTYIDVLQIHRLDRDTPMEEIMKALNDVIESGKVRYIGGSSMAAWEFQMMQNIAEKNGWHKFISMQGFYNLVYREEEREMRAYCTATGVGYMPWSPLAAGVLAHAWDDRTDPREQTDVFLKMLFRSDESQQVAAKEIVRRVQELSKKKGVSMAQVATAWALGKENSTPIMGLDSIDRVEQAVVALTVKLTEEEVKYLEEPYVPKAAMPF